MLDSISSLAGRFSYLKVGKQGIVEKSHLKKHGGTPERVFLFWFVRFPKDVCFVVFQRRRLKARVISAQVSQGFLLLCKRYFNC